MKKKFLLTAILTSALLLTACGQKNNSTSQSSSTTEKTTSSSKSSSKENTGFLTYSDGSKITVNGKDFKLTHSNGMTINYNDDKKSYAIHEANGSTITKNGDGSYAIVLASGDNITFKSNGTYVVTTASGSIKTGNGADELNKYLSEKGLSTISDYDKKISDILEFIKKNK